MPSVEGLESRRVALRILDSVLRRGQTLDSAAAAANALQDSDRALAVAIAGEVLRRIPDLDSLIDSATKKPLPSDSKARMVLRMALAQKIALGTPDHAVVATALPLVDGGPRRLVHGVLGTLLRRGVQAIAAPRLPEPVEERWTGPWSNEVVESARRLIGRRAPLDLSFKDEGAALHFAEQAEGLSLAARHVRLTSSESVPDLSGFKRGEWWVQDLAASLPARLIPAQAGEILDLCSAPGGKAMQMAAAGHRVTAVDVSHVRLERLSENLARTGLSAELICADALTWKPECDYDCVLLDAPCSATGTFRRHPEVLYRARPRTIAEMSKLQSKLIARAAKWVRPGGTLVYSVCSLEPDEGEKVVADFLACNAGFSLSPPATGELPHFVPRTAEGWVRTLPHLIEEMGGLDGFFTARLVRRA